MAKKLAADVHDDDASPKQTTMGFEDQVPKEVQDAADDYVASQRRMNKAREKFNGDKEVCITAMRKHGVTNVRVDNGKKMLELSTNEKVAIKKLKEPTAAGDDDDEE